MGQRRTGGVIALTCPAVETVVRVGVGVHLGGPAGKGLLHRSHRAQRDVGVMLGVVELHGAGDPCCAFQLSVDAAAVVGHGRVHARGGRGQVGQAPAHAVAHGPDLTARCFGPAAQCVHRRADVSHGVLRLVGLHQRKGPLPVVARVAQLHPRRITPEAVRRQHHETVQRVLLGHGADVLVDAEDLLEQHQPRAVPFRRQGQVAGKAGCDGDPFGLDGGGHGSVPSGGQW